MGWAIQVEHSVRHAVATMEPALREELIEFLSKLADAPAEFLRRAEPEVALLGQYLASYHSQVHEGVEIVTVFTGFDDDPPTLILVAVRGRARDLQE